MGAWHCSSPGARSVICFFNFTRFLSAYFSSCQDPSGWQHNRLVYPSLVLIFSIKPVVHSPIPQVINKFVKTGLDLVLIPGIHQEFLASKDCATDHHPLGPTVLTVFNPPACLLIQPISFSLWIWRDTVSKSLSEVQALPLPQLLKPVISSQNVVRLVKHDFPWVDPCGILQITFLSFMCLLTASRIICSITFSGIRVRLTGL